MKYLRSMDLDEIDVVRTHRDTVTATAGQQAFKQCSTGTEAMDTAGEDVSFHLRASSICTLRHAQSQHSAGSPGQHHFHV